jgi:hypothetical protein
MTRIAGIVLIENGAVFVDVLGRVIGSAFMDERRNL